ncbi:MAG: hypothetical protein IJH38_02390, partial [Clostridia bacterium]|nr:hypothetical protein [Clostridia bacterium]
TASYENALQRLSESLQITWERGREAPVSAGERMATISLQVDGLEPVSAVLTASRDVAVKPAATRAPAATAPAAEETEPPSSEPSPAGSSAKTSGAFRLVLMGAGALLILALAVLIGVMRHDRLRRKKRRGSARSGSRRRGSGRSASPEERPLPRRR